MECNGQRQKQEQKQTIAESSLSFVIEHAYSPLAPLPPLPKMIVDTTVVVAVAVVDSAIERAAEVGAVVPICDICGHRFGPSASSLLPRRPAIVLGRPLGAECRRDRRGDCDGCTH